MNVFKPKNKCLARFYNWSSYYALAVIELGQAIKANRALTSIQSNAR
jgi:membrane-bound lytic murein transglycosylase B